jgi:hypothetical protein
MDDRTIPPPAPCTLMRSCETTRLQRQLLAQAYQQIYPEIRRLLHEAKNATPMLECPMGVSSAARVAAGAESCCIVIPS